MKVHLSWGLVALGLLLIALFAWGRHPVVPIPRIVTQYDTVRVIDTVWLTKLKRDTLYKTNIVERIITTPPETARVAPPLSAVTAVSVGPHRGDSTLVLGFSLTPLDTGYTLRRWERQFWTPGPLRSIRMVGETPAVTFDAPPSECDFRCRAKIAGGGALLVELLRTVFGHP